MLFSVEQAFVGRDEKRAPLKTPAWEATLRPEQMRTDASVLDWNFRVLFPNKSSPKISKIMPIVSPSGVVYMR